LLSRFKFFFSFRHFLPYAVAFAFCDTQFFFNRGICCFFPLLLFFTSLHFIHPLTFAMAQNQARVEQLLSQLVQRKFLSH
jgi:hypothetical protein